MQKWEYQSIHVDCAPGFVSRSDIDEKELTKWLNMLGSQGWEVCSSVPVLGATSGQSTSATIILKRPLPQPKPSSTPSGSQPPTN